MEGRVVDTLSSRVSGAVYTPPMVNYSTEEEKKRGGEGGNGGGGGEYHT